MLGFHSIVAHVCSTIMCGCVRQAYKELTLMHESMRIHNLSRCLLDFIYWIKCALEM